jgi:hypothetical protein
MKMDLNLGNVTDTMLKQLPFIKGKVRYAGVDKKHKPLPHTWLYTVDDDSVDKINALLKGGALVPLPAKSKGYVIPGCKYSVSQLRDIARINNWTITNDASKADFFIGHSNNVSRGNADQQVPNALIASACPIMKYDMPDYFSRDKVKLKGGVFNTITDTESWMAFSKSYYRYYDSWSALHGTETEFNFLHSRTVEMLYCILSMKTPVIDEDLIFNSIERITIDDSIYRTLSTMFNSDIENRNVAGEMLFNCNYETSMYYIYKLLKEDYYQVTNTISNANIKIMHDKLDFNNLRYTSYPAAIKLFLKKGWLTEEIYDNLIMDTIEENIKDNLSDEARKFVKLTPSWTKTYQEFMDENKPKEEPKTEDPLPF